jgi:SAM-dependent methyltransferase
MPQFSVANVRRYYDRHTRSFIRFGQGGSEGAIHRAVWGPGVGTRSAAFHYVDDRIAELAARFLKGHAVPHVVDLGCGVGASLCYLAGRLPIRGTGLTVSTVQARLATQRIRDAQLTDRITCIEADFCDIPSSVGEGDLAYAIESFVHAPSPHAVLASCARVIRADGLLVICDDFARRVDTAAARQAIDRFRHGWHINTLISRDELCDVARRAGFALESAVDLSSALEIRRFRDRAINAVVGALNDWIPMGASRFDYLSGGSALQECLARGWIGYDFIVFRRV